MLSQSSVPPKMAQNTSALLLFTLAILFCLERMFSKNPAGLPLRQVPLFFVDFRTRKNQYSKTAPKTLKPTYTHIRPKSRHLSESKM